MRKRKPKNRVISPDPRFSEILVTQFVNNLMYSGKKSTAFSIFYDAMDRIGEKTEEGQTSLDVFKKAVENVTPQVEVRSRRIGGANFQIPTEIPQKRRLSTAMKWIIKYSRARGGKSMAEKLANELLAASKGDGAAVKKKEDTHKMAESNRAFAHFRV